MRHDVFNVVVDVIDMLVAEVEVGRQSHYHLRLHRHMDGGGAGPYPVLGPVRGVVDEELDGEHAAVVLPVVAHDRNDHLFAVLLRAPGDLFDELAAQAPVLDRRIRSRLGCRGGRCGGLA